MQKLTKEQSAIIGLYTGIVCGSFGDIHELAEKLMGHPVLSHQFGDALFVDTLKEKVKPLFLEICSE